MSGPKKQCRHLPASEQCSESVDQLGEGVPLWWSETRPPGFTRAIMRPARTRCQCCRWPAWTSANGLSNHRPYQINEYATLAQQNPGAAPGTSAAWSGPAPTGCAVTGQRARALRLRSQPADQERLAVPAQGRVVHLPLLRVADRQHRQRHPRDLHRRVRHQGQQRRQRQDLLGSNGNAGTVNLTGLNTTSVVANNQVRAILQQMPYNGGHAVAGPVTIFRPAADRHRNAAPSPSRGRTRTTATPSPCPPSNTTFSTVAVVQHSG